MINHHYVHALMVAAGRGSRFGVSTPKQYLPILGKTVLEHSVASLNHPAVDSLTLVVAAKDEYIQHLNFDFDKPIVTTFGGSERFLSVKSGVDAIRQSYHAKDDDWVLIHDAVRPCLSAEALNALLEQTALLTQEVGAILAVPVVDTLKLVKANTIEKTVSRHQLWQAQTPQIFRLKALEQMLCSVITQNMQITDEASGFESLGYQVKVVMGTRDNIKLTYPEDKPMIEMILQYHQNKC